LANHRSATASGHSPAHHTECTCTCMHIKTMLNYYTTAQAVNITKNKSDKKSKDTNSLIVTAHELRCTE
jgi:hypothetical protein